MQNNDDGPPSLDDFEEDLKTINYSVKGKTTHSNQDYTKVNTRHIQDEKQQQQQLNLVQQKVNLIQGQISAEKPKQTYAGFKKGFFSTSNSDQKQKIPQLKVNKKNNPLQFKEVQEAMKMNNYLEETKKEWMTDNFLTNIQKNDKVQKLFTNPEYMKAIDLFKTNPKEAMAKYGNNKQFMEGFQEFCKLMGGQFMNLSKNAPKK